MAFSFFKKPPEKMVVRAPVVPRLKETRETNVPPVAASPQPLSIKPEAANVSAPSEYSDFVFSESSPDFQIEADIDPIDAEAEEAAVLFANGQDESVRAILENAIRIHHFGPGERLWMMLFDLYRLKGNRVAFEALGIDYAQAFEKSPPGWRDNSKTPAKIVEGVVGSLLFRGDLLGENTAGFEAVHQALERNPRLRLDLSKVGRCDQAGCGRLLVLLQQARMNKHEIDLLGRDTLGVLIQEFVVPGKSENRECWLLFLELCQLQGVHEVFEDVAVDYAVTFEVSPPSWENTRVAAPEKALKTVVEGGADDGVAVNSYVLRGDIKALRFSDLLTHSELHDSILIDCSDLVRMDFISAGALLNVLTTIRKTGKQIVFRHLNHLVAELFGVVGLKGVASIVYARH